jgi:hypothetical protein
MAAVSAFFQSCRSVTPRLAGADEFLAVLPDEAAESLIDWTAKLDISKTGEYWAPRGPRKSSHLYWNDLIIDCGKVISALLSQFLARVYQHH